MARFSRGLLWVTVLGPIIILPLIFISSRIWLNHHLRGTVTFGDFQLHLTRPKLAWNYNFSSDSITLKSPMVEIQTSHLVVNIRFWQSLVSIRPNLEILTDSMQINFIPEKDQSASWVNRKRNKAPPVFPNIRIPLPFQIKVNNVTVADRARFSTEIRNVVLISEGPKGVVVKADSFSTQFFSVNDSSVFSPFHSVSKLALRQSNFSSPGLYRASARWLGRSVKYQVRFELNSGDYIKMEGGHRKTNLYKGVDSVDISIARISDFNSLFQRKLIPELTNIRLTAALSLDSHQILRTRAILTTPPTFGLGHEHLDLSSSFQDSSGHMVFSARGDSGESAYLSGQFKFPSFSQSHHYNFHSGFSTTLSGYSRNVRLSIGGKRLPGDLEIRRITIRPGLATIAEVKTKDSSNLILRLFKDSSVGDGGPQMAKGISIPQWVCTFSGDLDPRESWTHAWTDTNTSYRQLRVSGVIQQGKVECETWLKTARAYGAEVDSLYASHSVDKKGYQRRRR